MIFTAKKFSLFTNWSIETLLFAKELQSRYNLWKLGLIIKPRTERIKPADIPTNRMIVSKIRFSDGKIFCKDRLIRNDMYKAYKDDLLVSNINFEKGASSINELAEIYSSTDYTPYIIDKTKIIPDYLVRVLRCPDFMEYVSSVKPKGMKTRARYDFIQNFEIPVPPLSKQKELLDSYAATLAEADKNITAGDSFSEGLLLDIQSEVSELKPLKHAVCNSSSVLQFTPFATLDRWEVGSILKSGRIDSVYNSFKYKDYCISELQESSLFGLSVKASPTQKDGMIPILRMSNVIDGEIDFSELKYLPHKCAVTDKEPNKWLLRKGDFLVTRTNGSKDLVGKAAVFHSDGIYTYASYLIRYRFKDIVLPEYVNILFMTPLVREQVAVMRRQGGGQYNLNSDEIGAIRIPVPPLSKQSAIVEKYYSVKGEAKAYYEKAQSLKDKAVVDFEEAIFS